MDRYGRIALGLLLIAAGVGGFAYCLVELIDIGTCASGGPYVSARPCPAGTEYYAIGMFPAVIAAIAGIAVLAGRGGRPTKPGLPPQDSVSTSNPLPFGSPVRRNH